MSLLLLFPGGGGTPVGQATETDTALPIAWNPKIRQIGIATETDTARPITTPKVVAVGQAAETDTAHAITFVSGIAISTIDGSVPLTGPSSIAEPGEVTIAVGTIDGSVPLTGPRTIRDPGFEFPDDQPLTFAHLYDTDGTTLISELPEQFSCTWQDVDSEPCAGRLSIPMVGWDDATGAPYETDWAELTPGRVLRCYLYGEEAFSWQIERPPIATPIAEDEEIGMVVTASGRAWTAVDLSEAVIDPPWTDAAGDPLNNPLNPSQRAYTFASDDFPRYDAWPAVESVIPYLYVNPQRYQYTEVITVVEDGDDLVSFTNMPAPLGFPVTSANWIWPTADTSIVGKAYMRKMFYVGPTPRPVTIIATGDNFYTLYLNGTAIFGETEDLACWREFKPFQIVLPAGFHTLAVCVENVAIEPTFANPGGFICAVYEEDADGLPTVVWCETDETWTGIAYPDQTPGFTASEIIFNMVFSAQVRGQLLDFDFDFTASHDSNGNPFPYIPGISFDVGNTILSALERLHDQHWIDYRFKPGSRTLQVYVSGSTHNASGAEYTNAVDIRSIDIEEAERPCNRLLVKWTRGYMRINDAASQVALGKIFEETLVVDTDDASEAQRRGEMEFTVRSDPQPSVSIDIEPQTVADRPYTNYGVRDTVLAPNHVLTPTVQPVVSISVFHDDEGNPHITIELSRRARIVEREELQLLRQIGSGIMGTLESSDGLTTVRAVSLVD